MTAIALIVHHGRAQAVDQAVDLARWLVEEGHEVRVAALSNGEIGVELSDLLVDDTKICEDLDLAISIGGDGSMLRAVDLVGDADVPVLGVNFGQLGYLSVVEPSGIHDAVRQWLSGQFEIEQRMRMQVDVVRADGTELGGMRAFNEAVVEKIDSGRTIGLAVSIDDEPFLNYAADGLIAATPTGSTAYSLSARGPIVDPTHEAIVFTPVSPHMLFDRSLVLNAGSTLRFEVIDDRPAALALDGRIVAELEPGDQVTCRAAAVPAKLIVFGPRDFHQILKAKFGLTDR